MILQSSEEMESRAWPCLEENEEKKHLEREIQSPYFYEFHDQIDIKIVCQLENVVIDKSMVTTLFEVQNGFFKIAFKNVGLGYLENGECQVEQIIDAFNKKNVPDTRCHTELEAVGKNGRKPFRRKHDGLYTQCLKMQKQIR